MRVPDLGFGAGLRVPHHQTVLSGQANVDFFEVITENFLVAGGRPLQVLEEVAGRWPVVLHGVSMYPGSANPVDEAYLIQVRDLARRVQAPWVSDHLCWGSVGGKFSHDLLPLPYTQEAIRWTAQQLKRAQEILECPLAVENLSSYVQFAQSEYKEWEFLQAVAEEADVGILLDVNNIYVSSVNHGFDPMEYLAAIDGDRVFQIHLAGHRVKEGFLLDTHDQPVPPQVWELYTQAMQRFGPRTTLIEWDDQIPEFSVLEGELAKARSLSEQAVQTRQEMCGMLELKEDSARTVGA